ncbi:MAG: PIG-L family deacetylase [Selenomonadaceae bacterium]|nr:PIG-L family deacetylase [Selenomonadaceae bacterium]
MDDKKIFKSEACGVFELVDAEVRAEEILTAGNSFFDKNYFGTRVLILAPHPDDEINIAGNMILNLAAAKAEIFVAYSTDGGLEVPAEVRAREAITALKILGVSHEKIIFMGYSDGQKLSEHTRKNFKRDLKNLLLELRANIIFCVDFDSHPDHRTLSILFEEVLGEILSERSDYRPEVYKKFAYATAFTAAPDFYATNLRATKKPKLGETDTYDFDFIDRANYVWEQRVRFPVAEICRQTILKDNPIAEAIFAHKSQRNEWNALRILNSDEIFFERRTDSLTFSAKVTATSGDASKVRDFKIIDTKNVDAAPAQIENNLWQGEKINFEWKEAVQVERIVIYGNPLDDAPEKISLRLESANAQAVIDKAGIYLDNVKNFNVELPSRGRPLVLDIEKIFVTRAEIKAVDAGKNFGLAEVEFFANAEPLRKIQPFIKITAKDNFIYSYAVPYEVDKISLGLYRFHVDAPVKISATAGDENILSKVLTDGELILNFGKATEIVVTAEVIGDATIYDRVIIRRVGDFAQIQLKVWQWLDKLRVHKIRKVDR